MGEKTPLWVSEYGEVSDIGISGLIQVDNKLVISTKTFKDWYENGIRTAKPNYRTTCKNS